ncbi:chlorophyll a/b binding light-harvesting protein [Oscillatoria sp. CS-180]|uniref:chlorophyll a/b binding light-harvesting protein n=1 Tax=Oscillatoria sp. CS-180 TaxID=3021720 RepID=UPI00233137DD|nr:chlorophyll a/b binding light-harvesting protein [Oscillatoria sp. CS-180]MDB9527672.1 chlorophyll a/b binding light-harvesting protein [Oscillatoria sp. CS-180]
MHASSKIQEQYPWWAGNARFINLSNTFIVAHAAQAALIMLWAGAFTLFELAVYSPKDPLYAQGLILLPHLATEGWGVGSGGAIVNTSPIFAIGVIHIVAAGVLAGGAYFHRSRLSPSLKSESGNPTKFHFEWDDAQKLGLILGHHLVILGIGALLLVAKALFFGGLYDANIEDVRLVTAPTLNIGILWDYRTHLFDVSTLEDLVGGHILVALLLILGGTWHILVPPFKWVRELFQFSADGILSYSLLGLALAGFAASYYCGFNTLAYPVEFYGPTLELKSSLLPYYFDPNATLEQGYTSRTWLANTHFYLAFFVLQGSLWHFQRSLGLDFDEVLKNWQQRIEETSDNPSLVYQDAFQNQPKLLSEVQYGAPDAEPQPLLKREQPFEDYVYCRSQGIKLPDLTTINGVHKTLYQIDYHLEKDTFYQPSALEDVKARFDHNTRSPEWLYEQSIRVGEELVFPEPLNTVDEPGYGRSQSPMNSTGDTFYQSSALKDAKMRFKGGGMRSAERFYEQPQPLTDELDSSQPLDAVVYEPSHARNNTAANYEPNNARGSNSGETDEATLYQAPTG